MFSVIKADESKLYELASFSDLYFDEKWPEASFSSEIKKPNSAVFCAINESGEICGVACVENQYGDGYLHNIAVSDSYRRHGIGQQLINECVHFLEQFGVEKTFLEVRISNVGAVKLYEKIGFKLITVRNNFYSNPIEDAYSMVLEII